MPCLATRVPPGFAFLLIAVYGRRSTASNGVTPMSVVGYKQTLAGLKTTSALHPGADLPGGVAGGPFLTQAV